MYWMDILYCFFKKRLEKLYLDRCLLCGIKKHEFRNVRIPVNRIQNLDKYSKMIQ